MFENVQIFISFRWAEVQRDAAALLDAALPRVRLLALRRLRPRHEDDREELPVRFRCTAFR